MPFPKIHSEISEEGIGDTAIESVTIDAEQMFITTKKGDLFEIKIESFANEFNDSDIPIKGV